MEDVRCERGYCAGVFDLFHVGHVNLFRNAKQKCKNLVVGVLTDDLVMHFKGHKTVIPFEERIQMVESCKFVDEAIPVTFDNIGKLDAWNMVHYDLFFSGDDYSGNATWEKERAMLREKGADIFFFPYTKETSSSQIRNQIKNKKDDGRISEMNKTAVFTIASKNYFAYVKTLMKSLETSNPELERYVVVVDDIDEEFANLERNFELINLDELNLPEENLMKFRYTIMEFNTAVKPFVFTRLFRDYERVVYLDPDIYVFNKLAEVYDAFDRGNNFVLTPHLLDFYPNDGKIPDEPYIMRSGIYNLGFLALQKNSDTIKMVNWWSKKLTRDCVVDLPRGVFVDQKWIDLIPGIFDNVYILRHPGYNVAYWNMSHRHIQKGNDGFYVNGYPLVFFHYSGVNPDSYENVSKHQNRYVLDDINCARELFDFYVGKVKSENFDFWKKYKYSFNTFSDRSIVTDVMRKKYRESDKLQYLCGDNPFECPEVFEGDFDEPKKIDVERKAGLYDIMTKLLNYQQIIVYGLGVRGLHFLDSLLGAGFGNICGICDNKLAGQNYRGLNIYSHEQIVNKFSDAVYIVTPAQNNEIVDSLLASGVNKANIFIYNSSNETIETMGEMTFNDFEKGINLVGYLRSEHGVGEAGRMYAQSLNSSDISWNGIDFEHGNTMRQQDRTLDNKITDTVQNNVSLIVINADQIIAKKNAFPQEIQNTYKVGVWFWELPEFPKRWNRAFDMVDEIWAPTKFIKECLEKQTDCPVVHMPPGIYRNQPDEKFNREYFNLPKDAFLFLNMFDINSYEDRKNPEAAIYAFQKSFRENDMSVGLVLKMNNYVRTDEKEERIKKLIGCYKNIYVFRDIMSREEVNALLNVCDAAVSLHRSEGLGLLCEEAMFFGKPVIATGWSGNMDFMTEENSCLVSYNLHEIGKDIGPYESWQMWAEPSVDDAAAYMKRLVEEKDYYNEKSEKAFNTIRKEFSPKVCGEKMHKRFKEIEEQAEHNIKRWDNSMYLLKWKIRGIKNLATKMGCEPAEKEITENNEINVKYLSEIMADSELITKMDDKNFIIKLYENFFERSCRDDEMKLWSNALASGAKRRDIIKCFLESEEFKKKFE